jgi:signal transduction histidine kinase/FixJ family two-component response regulator
VVDDAVGIHEDFRKILIQDGSATMEQTESLLFGLEPLLRRRVKFELDSAYQGRDAVRLVENALAENRPYGVAFVDVRTAPGWDGIETISQIWAADPGVQIVLCTAYSDYSWDDLQKRFGPTDSLVVLKKPFDKIAVLQLAHALVKKWQLTRQSMERLQNLDRVVAQHTEDLRAANEQLMAFANLGQRLNGAKTVRDAALIIVEVADQLIGWTACVCDTYSSEEDLLSHVLSVDLIDGLRCECEPGRRQGPPPRLAERAIRHGGQLILRDPTAPMPSDTIPFGDTKRLAASLLFVPIRNGQKVTGVLSIQHYQPNAYDQRSLRTLQALADHCGSAFDRLQADETLRQTQDQLRQTQKLEAIGQLAGGVAHDFNNLLAVIRGNAELVLMRSSQFSPEVCECLNQVTAAADRAAGLTRQLLAFGRKQMMQPRLLDLNEVIRDLARMLKRVIGEHIELRCTYAERLAFVRADIGMIEQVLMNLVVNARDALPRGGHIFISTQSLSVDSAYTHEHPEARVGEFVSFSVKDTGTGIPVEHLPRIFDPFFTTKEVGKGTGLGLATVYGIAKQHRGWVEVTNQPGQGASFTIFLPAVEASSPAPIPTQIDGVVRGGTESILLVEDDDSVRLLTRRCLEKFGYRVHAVDSAVASLEFWRSQSPRVDILLTDIVMPGGITGRELAERLRAEKSSLKVIFMSGYSGQVLGGNTEFIRKTKSRFLTKPSPANQLLTLIREYLDEK